MARDEATGKGTKRICEYATEERTLVGIWSGADGVGVFNGKVRTPAFYAELREWDPESGVVSSLGRC